jgi:hypothetical protein
VMVEAYTPSIGIDTILPTVCRRRNSGASLHNDKMDDGSLFYPEVFVADESEVPHMQGVP